MTKHYELFTVTKTEEVLTQVICNGCGAEEPSSEAFSEVIISVRDGEEGGAVNIYDYCETCILRQAPVLIEAGSTAPYLTGEEPTE